MDQLPHPCMFIGGRVLRDYSGKGVLIDRVPHSPELTCSRQQDRRRYFMETTTPKTSMVWILICAFLCIVSETVWAQEGVWLNIGTPAAPRWAFEPEIQRLYWNEYQRVINATNQAYAKEPGIIGSYGRKPTNRARFM